MSTLPHYEFRRLLETTDVRLKEIAQAAGVSHTTVYRWKVGRARPARAHIEATVALLEEKHRDRADQIRELRAGLDGEAVHA